MSGLTHEELSTASYLDAGATGSIVKATGGTVCMITAHNASAAVRYVKLYNKATAAAAADTPKLRFHLAAGASLSVAVPNGIYFPAGIGVRCVTGVADNDNTGATLNDVLINIAYK